MSAVRIGLALAAMSLLLALVLFLPAGRIDWVAAWVWLGSMTVGLLIVRHFVVRAHPDLPARRRTTGEGTPAWDRHILAVFRAAMVLTLVVAGLDAGRFGWSSIPPAASMAGVGCALAGLGLFGVSVVHNPFFESTVRIQTDHRHTVTSTGPYRVIRHPGYAGLLLIALGTPIALRSAWALIPGAIAIGSLVVRTAKEDGFLEERLSGYAAYAGRTRYRLIPWVW